MVKFMVQPLEKKEQGSATICEPKNNEDAMMDDEYLIID
jgi:hypothetical protein